MQLPANGIALEVEDHGPPGGEPVVLIMGLGMQLVAWPDDLVAALVGRGFRVIRFDNRDIGLSQRFDHLGVPSLASGGIRYALRMHVTSPYTLADMARDTVGLLDALAIRKAHVVGASMGGMIAQHLGARHGDRVRSLTLMMTTSGARRLPQPSLKVRMALLSRPADARDPHSVVDHFVRLYGVIGSPGYPPEPVALRERLLRSIQRSYRPQAVARQITAIAADGDRTPLLGAIRAPVHVIHGLADPLVPVEAGRDLHRRIGGSTIDLIEGFGHDLPQPLLGRFALGIAEAAARA